MSEIINFFKDVLAGAYNWGDFIGHIGHTANTLLESEGLAPMVGFFTELGAVLNVIIIAFGLLNLFYGKKFVILFRSVAGAVLGYAIGVSVLHPVVAETIPDLTAMWCGIIVGVVLTVLMWSELYYRVSLYAVVALFSYVIFYAGGLIPIDLPTVGNATLSYIAVGAVVLVFILFHKHIERIGTSFLGAFLIHYGVTQFYDYTALIPAEYADYAGYAVAAVICLHALVGFRFQHKRRRRY